MTALNIFAFLFAISCILLTEVSVTRASGCTGTVISTCPGWMKLHKNMCYSLVKGMKSRKAALTNCRFLGKKSGMTPGDLATIPDSATHRFLLKNVINRVTRSTWIGLNDIATDGQWSWEDGTSYSYNDWAVIKGVQQPAGGAAQGCVVLEGGRRRDARRLGKWNDVACSRQTWSICQYPAGSKCDESAVPTDPPTDAPTKAPPAPPTDAPTVQAPTAAPISCPGWMTSYNGKCYKRITGRKTWADAQTNCETLGAKAGLTGNLGTIPDLGTFQLFTSLMTQNRETWIGLSDSDTEGKWTWQGGEAYSYTKWATVGGVKQPAGGAVQNCALITSSKSGWNDAACSTSTWSICQFTLP